MNQAIKNRGFVLRFFINGILKQTVKIIYILLSRISYCPTDIFLFCGKEKENIFFAIRNNALCALAQMNDNTNTIPIIAGSFHGCGISM